MASSFSLPLLSHPKAPIALSLLLLLLASAFYSRQSLPFPSLSLSTSSSLFLLPSPALNPNPNYSISHPPLHPTPPLLPPPPPDDDSAAEDEDEGSTSVSTPPPSAEEPSIFEQGFTPAGDRGGVVMQSREAERCDLYKGTWVRDEEGRHPLYSAGSCPYVDEAFSCKGNGREDEEYLKWRWKPDDCELPRAKMFSGKDLYFDMNDHYHSSIQNREQSLYGYLRFHSSDRPEISLVSMQLNGDNYATWSRSMSASLSAKNKIGFIDGSIKRPSETDEKCDVWKNVMIWCYLVFLILLILTLVILCYTQNLLWVFG